MGTKEALDLLETGLSIWENKLKTKYQDKVNSLKKEWYEAYNSEDRNNALIDNIEFELRILANSFCAEVRGQKA